MRVYWMTWLILLGFTIAMLWADAVSIPRAGFVVFMLAAMLAKASIIGGNIMHLRRAHRDIVLTVVVGLLVGGGLLFALIAPDAARIHEMVTAR